MKRTVAQAPRWRLIDTLTGEVSDAEIRPSRQSGGAAITTLYGPNWAALALPTLRELGREPALSSELRVWMCLLGNVEDHNRIPLRAVEIVEETGIERHAVSRILKRFLELGLIEPKRPVGWQLPPMIGYRGNPAGRVVKAQDGSLELKRR